MFTGTCRVLGRLLAPFALFALLASCDSADERVQEHFERGLELVEEGDPRKAILEFRNALQIDATHAPSNMAIARAYEETQNFRAAFVHYFKVIEVDEANVEAHVKLGQFYILGGDFEKSEESIERAIELDPEYAMAHTARATLAIAQEDYDLAREAIDVALAFDPDSPDAALVEVSLIQRTGSTAAALERLDAVIERNPDSAALQLAKLRILNQGDDIDAMARQLDVMVELFPETSDYYRARASIATRQERHDDAEADLRKLVELTAEDGTDSLVLLVRFLRRVRGDEVARVELIDRIAASDEPIELQLLLARYDTEIGKRDSALSLLEEIATGTSEASDRARIELARLYFQDGRTEDGDRVVGEVIGNDPSNVDAAVFKTMRQIDNGELTDAIQTARAALNEAPNDVRLLRMSGRAQELSGNIDLANDLLASAVRADEFAYESVEQYVNFLLRTNRATAAETIMSEALSRANRDERFYSLLGYMRLRMENWLGVEEAAKALDTLNPERARELRASVLVAQERFEEGADMLADLPENDRRRAFTIATRVQGLVRDGKLEEAVDLLAGIMEEDPENVQAIGLSGNLYLARQDFDKAEELYRRVLEIDPTNSGAHSALSRLFVLKGDVEASRQQILEGLRLSPDDLILLARLASIHENEGRFEEAIEVYERLYELIPDSLLVANNLSSLLSDHRPNDQDAIDNAYTIASRLRSSDIPQYRDTYGWTRYLNGEYREALDRIEPVAEALPQNPWVMYHLGMIYSALKRPEDARRVLEDVLRLVGDRPFPPLDKVRATLAELQTQ